MPSSVWLTITNEPLLALTNVLVLLSALRNIVVLRPVPNVVVVVAVVVVVGMGLAVVGVMVTLTTLPLLSVVILTFACVVVFSPMPPITDVVAVVVFFVDVVDVLRGVVVVVDV